MCMIGKSIEVTLDIIHERGGALLLGLQTNRRGRKRQEMMMRLAGNYPSKAAWLVSEGDRVALTRVVACRGSGSGTPAMAFLFCPSPGEAFYILRMAGTRTLLVSYHGSSSSSPRHDGVGGRWGGMKGGFGGGGRWFAILVACRPEIVIVVRRRPLPHRHALTAGQPARQAGRSGSRYFLLHLYYYSTGQGRKSPTKKTTAVVNKWA